MQGKRVKSERKPEGGVNEVKTFFTSEGSTEAAAVDFWDWYEGNGWTQGKARTPLRQWKNAANRWIRNNNEHNRNGSPNGKTPENPRNEFIGTPESRADWKRRFDERQADLRKRQEAGEIPFA